MNKPPLQISDPTCNMPDAAVNRLLAIMRQLRDPHSGCPWDIEQDLESIAPHTIEEAYEVADAIRTGNHGQLLAELGDLLLQVVFLSQIADEMELFDFSTVVEGISDKLLRRHPHVFSDGARVATAAEQSENWEHQKALDRQRSSSVSEMDDIAQTLPALMLAAKVQQRAARVGFDFEHSHAALERALDELDELMHACAEGNGDATRDELGDLLFSVVNVARILGIDAESSLRIATDKFTNRFRAVEKRMTDLNARFEDLSPEARDRLWENAKADISRDSRTGDQSSP
ncbi:MAG: nucleoside triphosphate pyrophosphohydrolase [Rhodobacteraceae bacterium]|nr:nucleoside triphosphate pyrophosphohydrolase [Paracoccaceae bacterium]